jgi:hypothetical protein
MPGKGHIPELTERIVRSMKANTNRTAGGLGSNASPGLTRDRIAASARTSSGIAPSARSSKVDDWDITGTGTSSFTTTYVPIRDSWNLMLNGARVHRDEFTITGRTVTILDPADLFKGVTTQGSPWNLEIQYDYLSAVPVSPSETVGTALQSSGRTLGGNLNLGIPSGTQVGDLMLAHFAMTSTDNLSSVPTGWTLVDDRTQSGSYPYGAVRSCIYAKIADAGDLGATVTWGSAQFCGGMATFPGASSYTITANVGNIAAGVAIQHPAVTVPSGGSVWYVAVAAHDLSGGLSFGADTGSVLWSWDATYFNSATSQRTGSGSVAAKESTFTTAAARIGYSVVVS